MGPAALPAHAHQRLAEATEEFERKPGRWLQMEAESGTLGACQRILAFEEFVPQLTDLWEAGRLHQTVEAVVLEHEFAVLFTDDEKAVARKRLMELGYEVPE